MPKVQKIEDAQGDAFTFWCPGCKMKHVVPIAYSPKYALHLDKLKPTWRFSGDCEKPTISPEIKYEWRGTKPYEINYCHVIVREGWLIYLSGCSHEFVGQRMQMKDVYFERSAS